MAMSNRKAALIRALISVVSIAALVAIIRSNRPAPPTPEAPSTPGASQSASSSLPACSSDGDCGAGFRCVVPGVCSRACGGDADCPAGRRCAELRVMEASGAPGQETPTVARTCVRAGPG
jgi:hypothetical protein